MRIAVIGAGSHFNLSMIRSIYQDTPEGTAIEVRFMDIRAVPLDDLKRLTAAFNRVGNKNIRYSFHTNREEAIAGADHVLASFAVDFPDSFLRSCWVMKNHGMDFVEGETATPGALLATLRHLPPLIEIATEIKASANGAYLHIINNPMPRLVKGVMAAGYDKVAGHCHGTIGMRAMIGKLTSTDPRDIDLLVAGINHFHLVRRAVEVKSGRDLLRELAELSAEQTARWKTLDFTQWKMFEELGYLFGHGHWHNFDYLPYANQRMFRHTDWNAWYRSNLAVQARRGPGAKFGEHLNSPEAIQKFLSDEEHEQMYRIMLALSGLTPPYKYLSGNMPNHGHILNLPQGAIVELPAIVTTEGIQLMADPAPLPSFFEIWLRQHIAIGELSVRAVLENSRQAALEAIALDPTFRDCDCSPAQLLDEMLEVNKGLVPQLN